MTSEIEALSSSNMLPLELTLIVAATRSMGIGRGGALPWTGLKKEMAYFARVTKRIDVIPLDIVDNNTSRPLMNAVIMGRKTWESIPERFRPLKGRLNVILSRSYSSESSDRDVIDKELVKVSSITAALANLAKRKDVGKVFVIGGAEIYKAALMEDQAKRILLTRVLTDFECDTFFPVVLTEDGKGEWKRKSTEELDQWVGEQVPSGIQEESSVQYLFEMYERS